MHKVKTGPTRVLGIAVETADNEASRVEESLAELGELATTAGYAFVGTMTQKRQKIDRTSYFGSVKLDELKAQLDLDQIDVILADDELTGLQIRSLEEGTGRPVMDRTSLILEIFSANASSREGKMQVELALCNYQLVRLVGGYVGMSRQRGGIGAKGPGETKLETDRRKLRHQISMLKKELEKTVQNRMVQRQKRVEHFAPLFSLVGYTNAGKSTLLNALTGSQVTVHNGLFTTLDPTARRLPLPSSRSGILSDTVGFIQKLPHGLVQAFRATLEDVVNSQMVLHVVDVSHPAALERIASVNEVLKEIDVLERETIMVFNKMDRGLAVPREGLERNFPGCCFISAATGEGLKTLLQRLDEVMAREVEVLELLVPTAMMTESAGRSASRRHPEGSTQGNPAEVAVLRELRQWSRTLLEEWRPEGVFLRVEVPKKLKPRLEPWVVEN